MLNVIRYTLRVLLKRPAFSLTVVVILALGVGVNTAVFNLINAMLIRPLPYLDPDRLVALHETQIKKGTGWEGVSVPDYDDWKEQTKSFVDFAAYARRNYNASTEEQPERVEGCGIGVNLFPLLGVRPILGRSFLAEDGQPNRAHVVLISAALWQRRFSADPAVIGKTLRLDGQPHEIVGVMPAGFGFPEWAELWTPVTFSIGKDRRDYRWLDVIGRLRPGVTVGQAQGEMNAVASRLEAQFPASNASWGARVRALRDELMPQGPRLGMYFMLAAVGCVLLIVAANIATLMLAQGASRAAEISVRTALGARRSRIAGQFLAESIALALVGGGLGILLSVGAVRLMVAAVPVQIPYWIHFDLDPAVLLFGLTVSLLAALVFGVMPALRASRPDQYSALREVGVGSGGTSHNRLHRLLVICEFTISVVLLICAMLMVKSFFRLQSADTGYDRHNLLTMRLSLTAEEYKDVGKRTAFLQSLMPRLAALPGVASAAAVEYLPLSRDGFSPTTIIVDGKPVTPGNEPVAVQHAATANYFQTMEIPLLRGRDFTAHEAESSAPVVLVNDSLARRLWPGENAVGRRVRTVHTPPGQWATVIGVTRDIANSYQLAGLDAWPGAQVYVPYPQSFFPNLTLVVRTAADPARLIKAVREQVRAAGPGVPVFHVLPIAEVISQVLWLPRFWGQMFSAFGVLALLIAMVGVYGVTAYSVSQRKREIGIRVALGAGGRQLLRMVVQQGMALALIGTGVGLLIALAATRGLAAILYGVNPFDPMVYGGVLVLLAGAALLATYLPARRASKVDANLVLRS